MISEKDKRLYITIMAKRSGKSISEIAKRVEKNPSILEGFDAQYQMEHGL